MIENIKSLYKQLNNKADFIEFASAYFKKSFNTIKNHWLSKFGGWSVPKEYQEDMVTIMQNWIRNNK